MRRPHCTRPTISFLLNHDCTGHEQALRTCVARQRCSHTYEAMIRYFLVSYRTVSVGMESLDEERVTVLSQLIDFHAALRISNVAQAKRPTFCSADWLHRQHESPLF
jgi:hypothetical protein